MPETPRSQVEFVVPAYGEDDDSVRLETLVALIVAERPDVDATGDLTGDLTGELAGARLRSGWESVVVETDGWIFRFSRPGVVFEREVALLRLLRGRLPVPTPAVAWTGARSALMAYPKLAGFALSLEAYRLASPARRDDLAGSLASFLAAMHHALAPAEIDALGIPDPDDARGGVDQTRDAGRPGVDLARVPADARAAVGALLEETAARPPDDPADRVVLHDDFNASNLALTDPVGELAAVWDFSCVRLGPPSLDFRYLAGDSADLLGRAAEAYERITGAPIDRRAAVLAYRLEQLDDAFELDAPETLSTIVRAWSDAPFRP